MDTARGSFIANQWLRPSGDGFVRSVNPATVDDTVFEAPTDTAHVDLAAAAANAAAPAWAALDPESRIAALRRFARELAPRSEALARAITAEMGKVAREARGEARALIARVDLVASHQLPQVRSWQPAGVDGECRYHPLGPIAVLGPFNYPLHLVHAHVVPALATGNTVIIKPSERAPLSAQRYVEAWQAAGLPPVLQMVQGGADVGRALVAHPAIKGVAFTGSWRVGHAIQGALLDRPDVLAALEMGGQNMAVVLADADLDQALEGVLLGAFLTTGQRCTCTARVLVQRSIADAFIARLASAAAKLTFGDPQEDVFMGPLASFADRDRVDALCAAAVASGAEPILAATQRDGGAYRGPSIHLIDADHASDYTRDELFGPDLAITVVDDLDHAITLINASPYGLSASLFSARRSAFEAMYQRTRVGCLNWNRSTNRASGAMPFGGVGRSGNFRPAGSDAVRYTTYPVQVQWNAPGVTEDDPYVQRALADADPLSALEHRHRLEEACEPYGVYPAFDNAGASLVIALGQLGGPKAIEALAGPLVAALADRGVATTRDDAALYLTIPTSAHAVGALATHLADALHAVRVHHPARFLGRRPAGTHVPAGDTLTLPRSAAFMQRLIADAFVPDDKKPPIVDGFRSAGPYLASVDDDPLVIFDAASQIASHAAGLNPPTVLNALWTGRFGAYPIDNGPSGPAGVDRQLADRLREAAGAHPYVQLCNSGAEANEIAIATCSALRPGKRAVIAFEGSFHGRTLLALHSTWNPGKRLRFELDGHQARWVPFPFWAQPGTEPAEPEGWLDAWSSRTPTPPDAGDDPLLVAETAALTAVAEALADDGACCVIAEPMQSEGGEGHATARFFRALRVLTTAFGVPLIFDEVQTGFYLGGPFFWHRRFDLPTPPDVVTSAKKCQVGAVVSRHPIPVTSEVHHASAIRGQLYAELLAPADVAAVEADSRARLKTLAAAHPTTVQNPRAVGWSFGFDLPDAESLGFLIAQRLWRGYMLYGAGSRAVRFRLNPEMTPTAIDALFARLDASLTDLETQQDTAWRTGATDALQDVAPAWPPEPPTLDSRFLLRRVTAADWPRVRAAYEALQKATYEPARVDDFDHFTGLMQDPDTLCFIITQGGDLPPKAKLAGACIAFPLEQVAHVDGPATDPTLGAGETLYSADTTVAADHRGNGIGRALKDAQIRAAMSAEHRDGSPRYAFVTGRNRVGATAAMARLNARYGAATAERFTGQYGEPEAQSDYYRICLTSPRLPARAHIGAPAAATRLDLDPGLGRRLGDLRADGAGTEALRSAYHGGQLNAAVVNKLSLCNFATPNVVRAYEALRATAPRGLPHLVPASGRAEMLDKALRALKFHRGAGRVVIPVGPVDAGTSTAAARAVTMGDDPARNWFDWPSTADPTRDADAALADLRRALTAQPADEVLGLLIEPVYARTGRVVPDAFWSALRALADEHDVPIVAIENTTAGYRSGRGMWRVDSVPVRVDAALWWPGGQLGLAFVNARYHVPNKLTLISTWDGDELTLARVTRELRTARQLSVAPVAAALAEALTPLGDVHGEGLYCVVDTTRGALWQRKLAAQGVAVGLTDAGHLRVAPPLNLTAADVARLHDAVRAVTS